MNEPVRQPVVELTMDVGQWGDVRQLLETCFGACVDHVPGIAGRPVSVLLTHDQRMQTLNRKYRQKDQPTNVLSFPVPALPGAPLGDVALGLETCMAESAARQLSLEDHMCHLFVHGVLHLAGFDHTEDKLAREMEQMETRILRAAGCADPWAQMEPEE